MMTKVNMTKKPANETIPKTIYPWPIKQLSRFKSSSKSFDNAIRIGYLCIPFPKIDRIYSLEYEKPYNRKSFKNWTKINFTKDTNMPHKENNPANTQIQRNRNPCFWKRPWSFAGNAPGSWGALPVWGLFVLSERLLASPICFLHTKRR